MFDKPVSRERIMAFSRDGVFDIVLGVMLLAAAAYLYFDMVALGGIIVVLIVPLVQGLKRSITVPRLAATDLPDDVEVRMFRSFMVASVLIGMLALAGVAVFMLDRAGNLPGWLDGRLADGLPYALLTIVGVFLLIGTYATRSWRFIGYAVLIGVAYALMRWLDITLWVGLAGLGVVALVLGVVLAVRFVQTHPVLPRDQRVQFR